MPSRILVQALVLVVGVVYLVFFALANKPLGDVLHPLGAAASAATLFVLAFEHFIWRAPGFGRLTRRPNIRGTWRGRLASDWLDPETGKQLAADPEVYLVITQTYWTIGARLLTSESSSTPVNAVLERSEGTTRLSLIYRNEPRQSLRKRSPIHYGAVVLSIAQHPTLRLEGNYWTDRRTTGELVFENHNRRAVTDFASGQRLVWDASLPERTTGAEPPTTGGQTRASGESASDRLL
jgi:hypothetical protein